jgi:hypothetical protein
MVRRPPGQVSRPVAVHAKALIGVGFGAIDVGEGSSVDNPGDGLARREGLDGRRVADIDLSSRAQPIQSGPVEGRCQLPAQQAVGSGEPDQGRPPCSQGSASSLPETV